MLGITYRTDTLEHLTGVWWTLLSAVTQSHLTTLSCMIRSWHFCSNRCAIRVSLKLWTRLTYRQDLTVRPVWTCSNDVGHHCLGCVTKHPVDFSAGNEDRRRTAADKSRIRGVAVSLRSIDCNNTLAKGGAKTISQISKLCRQEIVPDSMKRQLDCI